MFIVIPVVYGDAGVVPGAGEIVTPLLAQYPENVAQSSATLKNALFTPN
jgi:hypothetical protein